MLSRLLRENMSLKAQLADRFDEYETVLVGNQPSPMQQYKKMNGVDIIKKHLQRKQIQSVTLKTFTVAMKGIDIIKKHLEKKKLFETFEHNYKIVKYIGGGAFGKVYEVVNRKTNEKFVAKFIKNECKGIPDEVRWLQKLNHKNVVKYVEHFTTDTNVIIIMRKDGENVMSLDEYAKSLGGKIPENTLRFIILQLMLAVLHLHDNGCAHFDIKSQNIIINEKLQVKLIDFGLANRIKNPNEEQYFGPYGTLINISPEMKYNHGYAGPEHDIWSIGVTTFNLVSGFYPFLNTSNSKLIFPKGKSLPTIDTDISKGLRQFLSAALTRHCRYRPTIRELLLHPWLKNVGKIDAVAFKPFRNRQKL